MCSYCRKEEQRNKNVRTFLIMFSKYDFELLADAVKKRAEDRGCAPHFRSFHLSLSRSAFVVGAYTPYLKDYLEEGSYIRERSELQNQLERVLACNKFGPSRRM